MRHPARRELDAEAKAIAIGAIRYVDDLEYAERARKRTPPRPPRPPRGPNAREASPPARVAQGARR